MIRFAWLQARTQTLIAAGLLAALAVAAAITGIQLSHLYDDLVANCHSGCALATQQFLSHDDVLDHALDILARAVPAVLGMFWGAPLLAREYETGTHRLVWAQSVSRPRWLVTKLVSGALATALLAAALTLTITWWYRSRDPLSTTPYAVFDRRDIAPIAYALFAFAAGALAGAVIRRTVPAMAATLAVFVLARVGTSIWVRPHLLAPVRRTVSLRGAGPSASVQLGLASQDGGPVTLLAHAEGPHNSWTLSSHLVTRSGHAAGSGELSAFLRQHCHGVGAGAAPAPPSGQGITRDIGPDAGRACLAEVTKSFRLLLTYQPAGRYWTFQWLEAGLFLALALAAALGCYHWVTRRSS